MMGEIDQVPRLDVPDEIVGERVLLRRFRGDDAEALAAYRSDPETARYQSWLAPFPLELARDLVAEFAREEPGVPDTAFQYAVELIATPGLIGDVMLCTERDPRLTNIGFTLAPERRGRGYATEAVGLVLEQLLAPGSPVHRVEARIDPRNTASAALLRRLGFTLEGVLRQSYWDDDAWTDDAVYGLLGHEYEPRRAGPNPEQ